LLGSGREAEQEFGVIPPAESAQQHRQGDAPGRPDRDVHPDVVDGESLDESDAESGRRNRMGNVDLERMDANDADEIRASHAAEQDRERDRGGDPQRVMAGSETELRPSPGGRATAAATAP
jgi:hypothetical protein